MFTTFEDCQRTDLSLPIIIFLLVGNRFSQTTMRIAVSANASSAFTGFKHLQRYARLAARNGRTHAFIHRDSFEAGICITSMRLFPSVTAVRKAALPPFVADKLGAAASSELHAAEK